MLKEGESPLFQYNFDKTPIIHLLKSSVMKRKLNLKLAKVLFILILFVSLGFINNERNTDSNGYLVIMWNDLGMHCANKDFSKISILPPFNNIHAQVIKVGDAINLPVLDNSLDLTYSIPGNTYSVGKTNFWDYAFALFGMNLTDNIGLTGAGLSGTMTPMGTYYVVEGVPLTPYTDADLVNEAPFQLGLVEVWDAGSNLITSTQNVVPVSNEINCVSSGCHSSETQILYEHESVSGFDPNVTPILCAKCHSDNALGMPGMVGVPPFSQAIHSKHGEETNDCYKCHPGPNTQCLRGAMFAKGMICQDCHGSVSNVGNTIAAGREPWLEEPSCGATACHGSNYAEEPGKLFRQSVGHGGLYCSACHGEPHAIVPSTQTNDNLQNISIQGYAGILNKCDVCHGFTPSGPGPHGIYTAVVEPVSESKGFILENNYPNPSNGETTFSFSIDKNERVYLDLFNESGQQVGVVVHENLNTGYYKVRFNTRSLASGIYYYRLTAGNQTQTHKMLVQ